MQALEKGSLIQAEGPWTTATLTVVEWNGDLSVFSTSDDLLMEKVEYDLGKNSYMVIYSYPKDNKNHGKSIKVQLSDIKVNDADSDTGKALVTLIAHPIGKHAKSVAPQAVEVQPFAQASAPVTVQSASPAPVIVQSAPQPVIVEEVGRPYYGPGYYGPEVIIGGGWWGHPGWHHR